jgi:hypothetical protein
MNKGDKKIPYRWWIGGKAVEAQRYHILLLRL